MICNRHKKTPTIRLLLRFSNRFLWFPPSFFLSISPFGYNLFDWCRKINENVTSNSSSIALCHWMVTEREKKNSFFILNVSMIRIWFVCILLKSRKYQWDQDNIIYWLVRRFSCCRRGLTFSRQIGVTLKHLPIRVKTPPTKTNNKTFDWSQGSRLEKNTIEHTPKKNRIDASESTN